MNRITVAIASPGDLQQEREAIPKVFTKWNDDNADLPSLHPKMWEFSTPELGDHPQHILNDSLIVNSDLLVAMFHARLGTPTPTANSGTVEEIREFIVKKGPRRVMLYFCKRPLPVDTDPTELTRLNKFKLSMRSEGLFSEYTTLDEFERELYRHLDVKVHQLLAHELPLPPMPRLTESWAAAKDMPVDTRLHEFIDFGTTLDSIANGFLARMEEFLAIDGCTNDKYYQLGAHVYTSAARCLDRFLTYSATGIAPQDIQILENISTRLKHFAVDIPKPGADFRKYWESGSQAANRLVVHVSHVNKCKALGKDG